MGESILFMNDALRDQDSLAGYGVINLAKLKSISQKYDPSQVFQTLQSNGLFLSKASIIAQYITGRMTVR